MHVPDPPLDEVELGFEAHPFRAFWKTLPRGVARRAVPDDPDVRIVRIIQDFSDRRDVGRAVSMLLHAELDAEVVASRGALRHRLSDLLQNFLPVGTAL